LHVRGCVGGGGPGDDDRCTSEDPHAIPIRPNIVEEKLIIGFTKIIHELLVWMDARV
ncbi:hypothetical protein RUM43_009259, partial [Polyplax serrata]